MATKLDPTVTKRVPLFQNANENFTMKREEYKQNEDLRLLKHFASWLTKVGPRQIHEESFEEDLLDGVILCKIMSRLNGSGMTKFHDFPSKGDFVPLDDFKSKENLVSFQVATSNLKLPISFGTEDLEKHNITRVVSTLLFLAHSCYRQGVTVNKMDQELLDKLEEMDAILGGAQLSWFQQLLIKLGLGDWYMSISIDSLKLYIDTLKHNIKDKIEIHQEILLEKTNSFKEALPEVIKTKILT